MRWRRQVRRRLRRRARPLVRAPARAGRRARRERRSHRRTPACLRGTPSPTTSSAFAARLQEAFAAMLEHTDAQIGRLVDFLERRGLLDNTLSDGALRQRRIARGRPLRRDGRVQLLQRGVGGHRRDRRQPPRRHRRPALALATTRGAGRRPATRRCAGTSRTPTAAACAIRSSCTGRTASPTRGAIRTPVLPRRRHRADDPRRRPARRSPSSTTASPQIPMHGASIAATFDDAVGAGPAPDPVLRADGPPRPVGRRLEGHHLPRAGPADRRRRVGAVPPRRRLLRVPRPLGASIPTSCAS